MYQLLNKYGQLFAFGLGILITVIYLIQVFAGLESFNALSDEARLETNIFNFGLGASIALTVLCVVILLFFGIVFLIKNPKQAVKALIPMVGIVGVTAVMFALSQPAQSGPMMELAQRFELTPNVEKLISAGLWTSIIMTIAALVAFAGMEVRNFFK